MYGYSSESLYREREEDGDLYRANLKGSIASKRFQVSVLF